TATSRSTQRMGSESGKRRYGYSDQNVPATNPLVHADRTLAAPPPSGIRLSRNSDNERTNRVRAIEGSYRAEERNLALRRNNPINVFGYVMFGSNGRCTLFRHGN